jgi:hypothetical protein
MDWAQIGPLVGVIVGATLKACWDWLNRRQTEEREDRLRFQDLKLDASAELVSTAQDLLNQYMRAEEDWRDDSVAVERHLRTLDGLFRASFLLSVLAREKSAG